MKQESPPLVGGVVQDLAVEAIKDQLENLAPKKE